MMTIKEPDSKRRRKYCFTWFNYPNNYQEILRRGVQYRYVVAGHELCPTTDKPHLQGYIELKHGMAAKTLEKICKGIHLTWPVRGSSDDNRVYCLKLEQEEPNDKWFEEGEPGQQGRRFDLEEAMDSISNGMDEMTFFEEHPGAAHGYMKSMDKYRMLVNKKKQRGYKKKNIRVYWGPTGTGKTRTAIEEYPEAFILRETQTGWWWDGYDGEECVIIDEFQGNIPLSQLLGILDGYSCQVAIKGGSTLLCAKTIIITSNHDPDSWYRHCNPLSRAALTRRIDRVDAYTNPRYLPGAPADIEQNAAYEGKLAEYSEYKDCFEELKNAGREMRCENALPF